MFISFLLSCFLISCSTNTGSNTTDTRLKINKNVSEKQAIFISFKTDGSVPISFGYYDSIFNFSFIRLIKGKNESDSLVLTNCDKFIIYDTYKKNCPFLLYKGDSINIIAKNKELKVTAINNKARTKEIIFFQELLKSENSIALGSFPSNVENEIKNSKFDLKIYNLLNSYYQTELEFSNQYFAKDNLSQSYKNDIDKMIKYEFNLNLLLPILEKPYNPSRYDTFFINILNSKLPEFMDSLQFYNRTFRYSLYKFNQFLCRNSLNSDIKFEQQFISAKNNFTGAIKEYLIYELLKTTNLKDKSLYNKYSNEFFNQAKNKNYINYFKQQENETKQVEKNVNQIILTQDGKEKKYEDVIKYSNSEYILIDFWATWCLPCIASFEKIERIKIKYKNDKITFNFISCDANKASWIKYNNKYNNILNIQNSFFLLGGFESKFAKQNNISSIPRYMLYNKQGLLLNPNISMEELEAILKK